PSPGSARRLPPPAVPRPRPKRPQRGCQPPPTTPPAPPAPLRVRRRPPSPPPSTGRIPEDACETAAHCAGSHPDPLPPPYRDNKRPLSSSFPSMAQNFQPFIQSPEKVIAHQQRDPLSVNHEEVWEVVSRFHPGQGHRLPPAALADLQPVPVQDVPGTIDGPVQRGHPGHHRRGENEQRDDKGSGTKRKKGEQRNHTDQKSPDLPQAKFPILPVEKDRVGGGFFKNPVGSHGFTSLSPAILWRRGRSIGNFPASHRFPFTSSSYLLCRRIARGRLCPISFP